jgi:hypothetical protein
MALNTWVYLGCNGSGIDAGFTREVDGADSAEGDSLFISAIDGLAKTKYNR